MSDSQTVSILTIAFCTRHRPADLRKAVRSVCLQAPDIPPVRAEILIIEDGALTQAEQNVLRGMAADAGLICSYINKSREAGLYRSRIVGIEHAQGEIVLFLDDDAELEPGYLAGLLANFQQNPETVAVGGVDVLCSRARPLRRLFELCIGYRARRPGALSASGYGGAMDTWGLQSDRFYSEFLSGCNMSFRRSSLQGLRDLTVFDGHATGEDLYLTYRASQVGNVVVDPALKIRHYQSPTSRDSMERVFFRQIYNHYQLLILKGAGPLRRYLLIYTASGLLFLSVGKCVLDYMKTGTIVSSPRVRGGWRGLKTVLHDILTSRKSLDAATPTAK